LLRKVNVSHTLYAVDFAAETVPFYHGETVVLPCNSIEHNNLVDWDYVASGSKGKQHIYVNGEVDVNSERYSVHYPLVISNAIEDDAGTYTCIENAGIGDAVATYHLQYEGTVLCHTAHVSVVVSV